MKCEFDYCIYNREFKCMVEEPAIHSFGMCDTCILISIQKDVLEKEKEWKLQEIENRWVNDVNGRA